MHSETNDRKNLLAVNLSLVCNVLLAGLKTTVGIVGHSPALLADGIMSISDVVYLSIVRIFIGLAGKLTKHGRLGSLTTQIDADDLELVSKVRVLSKDSSQIVQIAKQSFPAARGCGRFC